ncbi:hypothetical protein BG58_22825 [Caballeronia jiangsuensis]|nr:hypothetical protein BG58_22825 [Caballeronia jiangsuensis]
MVVALAIALWDVRQQRREAMVKARILGVSLVRPLAKGQQLMGDTMYWVIAARDSDPSPERYKEQLRKIEYMAQTLEECIDRDAMAALIPLKGRCALHVAFAVQQFRGLSDFMSDHLADFSKQATSEARIAALDEISATVTKIGHRIEESNQVLLEGLRWLERN